MVDHFDSFLHSSLTNKLTHFYFNLLPLIFIFLKDDFQLSSQWAHYMSMTISVTQFTTYSLTFFQEIFSLILAYFHQLRQPSGLIVICVNPYCLSSERKLHTVHWFFYQTSFFLCGIKLLAKHIIVKCLCCLCCHTFLLYLQLGWTTTAVKPFTFCNSAFFLFWWFLLFNFLWFLIEGIIHTIFRSKAMSYSTTEITPFYQKVVCRINSFNS